MNKVLPLHKTLTQSEVADLAGVTSRYIRKLENEQDPLAPPKNYEGKYEIKAIGQWLKRWHMRNVTVDDGELIDYEYEKARLTRAEANIKEMNEAQLRGELVPAGDVENTLREILIRVKKGVMALPKRLAPELVGLEQKEMTKAIDSECREVLTALGELDE